MAEVFHGHLFCPKCDKRHVDEGPCAVKPHHTHRCTVPTCNFEWRVEPYTFGMPGEETKDEHAFQINILLRVLMEAKEALRTALPYLREKTTAYNVGDRPMSPPAHLLRDEMQVEAALDRVKTWLGENEEEKEKDEKKDEK